MLFHWRHLIALLHGVQDHDVLLACIRAIIDSVAIDDIPDLFHEIIVVALLDSCDSKAKANISCTIRELSSHFKHILRPLIYESSSDGTIILRKQFSVIEVIEKAKQSPLLCGKTAPSLSKHSIDGLYTKSWLKKQKKHLQSILKRSANSSDEILIMEAIAHNKIDNVDLLEGLEEPLQAAQGQIRTSGPSMPTSQPPALEDKTSETWIARLLRLLISELTSTIAERRESAALGLTHFLDGLLPNRTAAMCEVLPEFLLDDILFIGTVSFISDQVLDFQELKCTVEEDDATVLPVKAALASLIVRAAGTAESRVFLIDTAMELTRSHNPWILVYSGLLLWREMIIMDFPGMPMLSLMSCLESHILSFAPVDVSSLSRAILREVIRRQLIRDSALCFDLVTTVARKELSQGVDKRECLLFVSVQALCLQCAVGHLADRPTSQQLISLLLERITIGMETLVNSFELSIDSKLLDDLLAGMQLLRSASSSMVLESMAKLVGIVLMNVDTERVDTTVIRKWQLLGETVAPLLSTITGFPSSVSALLLCTRCNAVSNRRPNRLLIGLCGQELWKGITTHSPGIGVALLEFLLANIRSGLEIMGSITMKPTSESGLPPSRPRFRVVIDGMPNARPKLLGTNENSMGCIASIANAVLLCILSNATIPENTSKLIHQLVAEHRGGRDLMAIISSCLKGHSLWGEVVVTISLASVDPSWQRQLLHFASHWVVDALVESVASIEEDRIGGVVRTAKALYLACRSDGTVRLLLMKLFVRRCLSLQTGFLQALVAHETTDEDLPLKLSILAAALDESPSWDAAWTPRIVRDLLITCRCEREAEDVPSIACALIQASMHSDLLSPLGVAFTEQIFAVLHDPRHDSIRIAIATVAAAIVDKFKETIATSCYGLWLDFAVHGLGDFCPDVRSRAISLFRSLVPLAPLAMKAPNPNKQGSEGRVSQLLHCLASKSGLPSLLQSSDGRDKFIVGAASIECATPLRPYQWGGVSWWTLLRRCGLSGMLADEMGLGKTLQALMCLAVIHLEHSYRELTASNLEQSKRRILPALIVVPASLASQWMQEISLHFPRGLLSAQLCTSIEHIDLIRSNHSTKVWITTYDFLRRNSLAFQSLAFEMVIVDEAHTIRNPATATAQAVHSLRAKSRLALTGTPIQNNVEDVWSVMQFLLPDYLGGHAAFRSSFERPIRQALGALPNLRVLQKFQGRSVKVASQGVALLRDLHKQVLPFILRRTKDKVAQDLPPKTIVDVMCPLSVIQRSMYEEMLEKGALKAQSVEDISKSVRAPSSDVLEEEDESLYKELHDQLAKESRRRIGQSMGGSNGESLVALRYLTLLCVHPALVISEAHRSYRERLFNDISSSGKILQFLKLCFDCGLVEANEVEAAAEVGLGGGKSESMYAALTEALEGRSISSNIAEGGGLSKGRGGRKERKPASSESSDSEEEESAEQNEGRSTKRRRVAPAKASSPMVEETSVTASSRRKCLVFVQHRSSLDLLERVFRAVCPSVRYARLDGQIPPAQRFKFVQQFNSTPPQAMDQERTMDEDFPLQAERICAHLQHAIPNTDRQPKRSTDEEIRFLFLTTRSCSLGLNLTAADTVVFLEHDWNPFVDLQAMDRVHRLGQTRPVTIFRLLADATLESRIMNAQSFKQFVAQHVVDGDPALSADHSAPSAFGQALWSSLLEKEKAQGSDKL